MPRVRITFTGELKVVTPLHLGSGDTRTVAQVKGREGSNAGPPLVAAIVRDKDGKPYLPAPSLKGLFRRLAEERLDPNSVESLFGTIKAEGGGAMGALLFRGATLANAGNAAQMPYANKAGSGELGPGVFVAARTRIERKTGTADDGFLYFQEMVAPGATFDFRLLLESRDADTGPNLSEDVQRLIAVLQEQGATLGKGQADGQGLVKLARCHVTMSILGQDGTFQVGKPKPLDNLARAALVKGWRKTLMLTCDGPFMIVDSSYEPPPKDNDGSPTGPQLRAQRLADNLALILGSSLTGAMRERARWIEALAARRTGRGEAACQPDAIDRPDRNVRGPQDVTDLTAVERLFGVTGYRARLTLRRLVVKKCTPFDITSVRLDRFSGAPIDGALFASSTFRDVEIEVELGLPERSPPGDEELAGRLIEDMTKHGLELGHGSGKGFGWFEVAESRT